MLNLSSEVGGPLDFVLKWLPSIGWPMVILVIWKASKLINKAEQQAIDTVETIKEIRQVVNDSRAVIIMEAKRNATTEGVALENQKDNKIFGSTISEYHKQMKEILDDAVRIQETLNGRTAILTALPKDLENIKEILVESNRVMSLHRQVAESHMQVANKVVEGFQNLSEVIHRQAETTTAQFNIMRDMSKEQSTIAANQNNITNGFQRMIEHLINTVRGS